MYSVFKPLTTILIISIAIIIYTPTTSDYSAIIILALFFSLIGDILLLNKKFFLYGLSSFFIAHVFFTIGFTSFYGFDWNVIVLIPLVIIAGVYYNFLKKDLRSYSIPVLMYMIVIVVMSWQAINLFIHSGEMIFLGIAIGSVLFSFSDSILAYDKFKKSLKFAEIIILSTYWVSIFAFTIAGQYME